MDTKRSLSKGADQYATNRPNGYNDFKPSRQGVSTNNPEGSTLRMKVQPTEGRPGIYTSTKGRNGGDLS